MNIIFCMKYVSNIVLCTSVNLKKFSIFEPTAPRGGAPCSDGWRLGLGRHTSTAPRPGAPSCSARRPRHSSKSVYEYFCPNHGALGWGAVFCRTAPWPGAPFCQGALSWGAVLPRRLGPGRRSAHHDAPATQRSQCECKFYDALSWGAVF